MGFIRSKPKPVPPKLMGANVETKPRATIRLPQRRDAKDISTARKFKPKPWKPSKAPEIIAATIVIVAMGLIAWAVYTAVYKAVEESDGQPAHFFWYHHPPVYRTIYRPARIR